MYCGMQSLNSSTEHLWSICNFRHVAACKAHNQLETISLYLASKLQQIAVEIFSIIQVYIFILGCKLNIMLQVLFCQD